MTGLHRDAHFYKSNWFTSRLLIDHKARVRESSALAGRQVEVELCNVCPVTLRVHKHPSVLHHTPLNMGKYLGKIAYIWDFIYICIRIAA